MRATKLTTAPQGFEYYRVCDQEGVCRVVRGMWAAQHLVKDTPASARLRHGSIQRNGISALISQGLLQLIDVLLQGIDPLLQFLLAGVLSLIHLLAAAVHHFGVGQSRGFIGSFA